MFNILFRGIYNIMTENRFSCGPGSGRESVSIETNRILDSCKDRDCFENVRVFLTDFGNEIVERTSTIRVKSSCITWTYINIDPVQFNKGFYTVTIRFYIKLVFEACVGGGHSQEFDGIAVLEKNVILYGGESNVSIFRSSSDSMSFCAQPEPCYCEKNVPTAVVEVVDPIVLGLKVVENVNECCCCCCCACDIPESITHTLSANLSGDNGNEPGRYLAVSLGVFSIIRIVRPSQYIVNATEYSIPDKECVSATQDDPCSVFRAMAFPTSEFSMGCTPTFLGDRSGNPGKCGC